MSACKFFFCLLITMMIVKMGFASPPSRTPGDELLAAGRVFGSFGNTVLSTATPEDVVAYLSPRLREALHYISGSLPLLEVVRRYHGYHRELFPMPPAASVLTVMNCLPGFSVAEYGDGHLISWYPLDGASDAAAVHPGTSNLVWPVHPPTRTTQHHPDGFSNSSSCPSSDWNCDIELEGIQMSSLPASPIIHHTPPASPSIEECSICSSPPSSPASFTPVRAPADLWNHWQPRDDDILHAPVVRRLFLATTSPIASSATTSHLHRIPEDDWYDTPSPSSYRSSTPLTPVSATATTVLASPASPRTSPSSTSTAYAASAAGFTTLGSPSSSWGTISSASSTSPPPSYTAGGASHQSLWTTITPQSRPITLLPDHSMAGTSLNHPVRTPSPASPSISEVSRAARLALLLLAQVTSSPSM